MKLLTVNFTACAVKSCRNSASSYPLMFRDAEMERIEILFNPEFIRNILPRIDWDGLRTTANELGFPQLPDNKPDVDTQDDEVLRELHRLLLETEVVEGKLVCRNCGHEYRIKEGIANFLLPSHLGS